ncbi:MAG: YlbE family protein [Anaerolineae bacterium]
MSLLDLFGQELTVVNVGLESFAQAIRLAGGQAVHLDWRPPAEGDAEIGMRLARTLQDPRVAEANQVAFERLLAANPVLMGIGVAREDIPDMEDRMLLHAGPPIAWMDMPGPMQGAIVGAILYEGWAESAEEAVRLVESDQVSLEPCHHHAAVGPMAGIISPSMPVWIVENSTVPGQRAYSNLNEGLGKALRFGANDTSVIQRLRWMADELAPALRSGLEQLGPVQLKPLMAQALHMGDEVHNRNVAASSLFFRRLAPALWQARVDPQRGAAALEFLAGNDHFFLNLSMASCKAMMDAAHGVPHSSLVTAMARNGTTFGIRVSGLGDEWFVAASPDIDGLFFPGYTIEDANPDMGDSSIAETCGLGGFAMGAAPAIVQFVGGSPQDAIAYTREMRHITLGANPAFTLPPLSFTGTPTGIDVRQVVDTGIAPVINTGIAHRQAGIGQVGAGVVRAPLVCFDMAVSRLAQALKEGAQA